MIDNVTSDETNEITALVAQHVADIVELLNTRSTKDASKLLGVLPLERAIDVFDQPGLEKPAVLMQALPVDRAVAVLSGMSADRMTDLFRHLPEPSRSTLLARLDRDTQASLLRLLSYPKDSAGSIMTTEFVGVPATFTIAQTLEHIRRVERSRETIYAIYVLDPEQKTLIATVTLRRLITGKPDEPLLSDPHLRRPITVSPLTDREEVARLISKYDLLAIPVVDESSHVLGIVTVDDVIDAIFEEDTEDVQKFGGMSALDQPYKDIDFGTMIRKRAGWLCALFLSEMLTATAMQYFQTELEKAIVLTLFIPLIMSSGGNSGSQATSLIIRALALRQINLNDWWRVAMRELPTGVVLGAILGLIGIVRITVWQTLGLYNYGDHWLLVALTVGGALVGIVTFGSLSGSLLPFILQRIGFDPASASAPFVATLVDVAGLIIYFGVAALILTGTLL